jgi:hypothetical protein
MGAAQPARVRPSGGRIQGIAHMFPLRLMRRFHRFIYVSPGKGTKESLRCDCGAISINLKTKGGG